MILAELEVFLSRPIAPTRRVALGDSSLPMDPAPGFGGVLLGGVAARFGPYLDEDLADEVDWLLDELGRGSRIAQPRLRHRLQVDRVGLQRSTHRLVGAGESMRLELDEERGTPAQHVLCAVYAAGRAHRSLRPTVIDVVRRGLRWRGDLGPSLIAQLSGHHGIHDLRVVGDPVAWALGVLCLVDREDPARRLRPSRRDVQQAFREGLRDAHPDHGGDDEAAAERIARLSEARRILLTSASVA
jgi:hypothetical protein